MNSGVAPLRIAARPLLICVCAQTMRLKGMRLLSTPMAAKADQLARSPGMVRPVACTRTLSATAARPTRASTTLSGGNSATATSAKKNEPPQSTDSVSSRLHSGAPMRSGGSEAMVASG